VGKWKHREEGKRISKAVIQEKSTEELIEIRDTLTDILEYRKLNKLQSNYIKGTEKCVQTNGEDKLYVAFNVEGTVTGRLSCTGYGGNKRKKMGISFHTLPRESQYNMRSMFVAPEGWDFWTSDYSNMELRVLAHIAQEGNMIQALNQGKDLHTYTASLLYSCPEDMVTKDQRQVAKAVSFLLVYGGSAFNLAQTERISIKLAEKIFQEYHSAFPDVSRYINKVYAQILEDGYTQTIFGRRRHLPDSKSKIEQVVNRSLRQGLNFTIQSAASDVLLCSLVGCAQKFKEEGMKARVVATVDDSIEFIAPREEREKIAEIIYNEMTFAPYMKEHLGIELSVPLKIDLEVGSSFGDGVEYEIASA